MIQLDDWQHGKAVLLEAYECNDFEAVRAALHVMAQDVKDARATLEARKLQLGTKGQDLLSCMYPYLSGLDTQPPNRSLLLALIDDFVIDMAQFAVSSLAVTRATYDERTEANERSYLCLRRPYFEYLDALSKSDSLTTKADMRNKFWDLERRDKPCPDRRTWKKYFDEVETLFFASRGGRSKPRPRAETETRVAAERAKQSKGPKN